jgi:hypothetical protein
MEPNEPPPPTAHAAALAHRPCGGLTGGDLTTPGLWAITPRTKGRPFPGLPFFRLGKDANMDEIEWESETWNPLCGCDVIEPECDECYAERLIAERHEQDRVD